jgi:nitric oxide reductase NorD protein
MDLLETIFQKIVQRRSFRRKVQPGQLICLEVSKYLDSFSSFMSFGAPAISTVASRSFVGLHGQQLFLPERIHFFNERHLNKQLYTNLTLQILAARQLKIFKPVEDERPLADRLNFLKHCGLINLYLDDQLPGYAAFQNELYQAIANKTIAKGALHRSLFKVWQNAALSRSPLAKGKESFRVRDNEVVPDFLYVSVPCLESSDTTGFVPRQSTETKTRQTPNYKTEKEKSYTSIHKTVDLEKEQANPVTHSFEKLETADEYNGGRRIDSGDDELNAHADALDELNLSKLTRGGESAQSAYSADLSPSGAHVEQALPLPEAKEVFLYPEWNFKKNKYLTNHCVLNQSVETPLTSEEPFKKEILLKNRHRIKYWQSMIQNLLSIPLWKNKLLEGDEVDIDEVVRDLASTKSGKQIDARWYARRSKQFNQIEVVLLFDQSMSSDSWIKNRRVLDVTLESVGIIGLLFEDIIPDVTVAGIWSATRHNCAFKVYKGKSDSWSTFYKNAPLIQAQGYTRLGPSIRHTIQILNASPHHKKVILLLTDGKPTDVDGYEGLSGISDVAQACREAESNGILVHALILDHKQKIHFSKMFKNHSLMSSPQMLSQEIFKVLCRLVNGS